jgi:single-stranded-DNA-specific exonuclease
MPKRWRIRAHQPERIAALSAAAGVPAVVAQLLLCRDITQPDAARRFLDPRLSSLYEPERLPGCLEAAEQIQAAIRAGRRIVIYGDYDADGVTGTALLRQCLCLLGGQVDYYIPHRIEEGYGLNHEAIRTLSGQRQELLVTVDCGIGSVPQAATVRECGMELIVTDHHPPGAELPEALAIVHPQLAGSQYPFPGLSGAGVAFKLAWALCQKASGGKRVSQALRTFLVQAVGLAALGTVADVVPLVDENRVIVADGLKKSLKLCPPLGLTALMKAAGLDTSGELSAEDVAFSLAPRLNAAGRLGQARLAVELLSTDRPERADELARFINQLNVTRQSLERSIYLAAHKQIKDQFDPEQDAALVLGQAGWHPGVVGIVAGKLAEKYHRPVVLIAWDEMGVRPGIGSARSVPGFNLHQALSACGHHLKSHGGHAAAAGLTIEGRNEAAFRAEFCEYAAQEIGPEGRVAELVVDAEVPLCNLTLQTVELIERLAPFGSGNARPLFCTTGVTLPNPPRTMGADGRHLSMTLCQHGDSLRAVAFGSGERAAELGAAAAPLDVAFRPVINTFRGRRSVELHLADWRPGRAAEARAGQGGGGGIGE